MRRGIATLTVVGALLLGACSDDDDSAPTTAAPESTAAGTTSEAVDTEPDTEPTETSTPDTSTPDTTAPADGQYTATVRRTTDGVPHITGDSLGDVMFGEGYANAEDHACTLADAILTPLARRAATFGPGEDDANIESDFAWAHVGLADLARADFADVSDDVQTMIGAYAAGWNTHLEEVRSDGLSGWCAGEEWVQPISAEDLYVYGRWVTLLASSAAVADMIPNAQPPSATPADTVPEPAGEGAAGLALPRDVASNAWALGTEKVTGGSGGLFIGNPHFPWEGSLRFWEVQLTVPGEMDIYGAMLIGLPGVGIGFTDQFAWSHTVSAGHRLTGYTLDLDPADPTSYLIDGVSTPMTATDHTVDVLHEDGTTTTVERTLYASEYGPIINFPGVGWTDSLALSYRDANLNNDEFVEQYLAFARATSFDEFVDAHRTWQGIPVFNTTAVSADGRAWYADTSATPNLSDEAEAVFRQSLDSDPLTSIAYDNGFILLDGSDSRFRWEEVEGARDPGLVPFDAMPMVEHADYVFNANDSFWMPHATEMLSGDYSILHGEQDTERSLRTRENAWVLSEVGEGTPAGADGTFTGEELRAAAMYNRASSATLLRAPVVERCTGATLVDVAELTGEEGAVALPAEGVDVSAACAVLGAWDGFYNLDSIGTVVWREFLDAVRRDAPGGVAGLWAVPFDPSQPLTTPSGLAGAAPGQPDAVLQALARAVQTLTKAGIALDAPHGDVQYALRAEPRIGLQGGPGGDGLTNVIDYSDPGNTTEPTNDPGEPVVPDSRLHASGYPVDRGTSFLMMVDYSSGEPDAWMILTYGETGDRTSPLFTVQTQRFADKDWRHVAFTEEAIAADQDLTELTVSGG